MVLDLVGEQRRRPRARAGTCRRGSSRRRRGRSGPARAARRAPAAAPRTARPEFGQCRSSRSTWSTRRLRSESSAAAPQLVGAEVARPDLRREPDLAAVHAGLGDRAPDLLLVLVRTRRVDVAVADLERVAHAVVGVVALHEPGPEAEARDRGRPGRAGPSGCRRSPWPGGYPQRAPAHVRGIAPRPARPSLQCPLPGRLAQLGERLLDKQEVTGSSPVSPMRKPCISGAFVVRGCVRDLNLGLNISGTPAPTSSPSSGKPGDRFAGDGRALVSAVRRGRCASRHTPRFGQAVSYGPVGCAVQRRASTHAQASP